MTASIRGVYGCGVPGAGGYDAVFAIVVGDAARARVAKVWKPLPNSRAYTLIPESSTIQV